MQATAYLSETSSESATSEGSSEGDIGFGTVIRHEERGV